MAVTPNYSWPVPVNTDYVKDGAEAIKDLGDAIDATVFGLPAGGLTLVKTQTVGTAVASVTVSGAFSATYDNYKIILDSIDGSVEVAAYIKLNNSAGSTYFYGVVLVSYSAGAIISTNLNAGTLGLYAGTISTLNNSANVFDVISPFKATYTSNMGHTATLVYGLFYAGTDKNAVSHTGFTLLPQSGTMTGGTIRVYGYQN